MSRVSRGTLAPIAVIIPTVGRVRVLEVVLRGLLSQGVLPQEVVIVDASADDSVERLCKPYRGIYTGRIVYEKAKRRGAAAQRNQGVAASTQAYILLSLIHI